jgi:hypothetical protein
MSLISPDTTQAYLINTGNKYIIDNSGCLYPTTGGEPRGVPIASIAPVITSYKTVPVLPTYEQIYTETTLDGGFTSSSTHNSKMDVSFNNPHDLTTEYDVSCNSTEYYSYGRCMACNGTTLTSQGIQYATQQKIWNATRVPSSVYTMNLASLNAYTPPLARYGHVNWNQMSDRPQPSVQKAYIPSGSGAPSSIHTVTRDRPGAMSPGGVGCDIKHNSYERYLNRLKGKSPLRSDPVPSTFGQPITNKAWPIIYGNKTLKLGIIGPAVPQGAVQSANACICNVPPF